MRQGFVIDAHGRAWPAAGAAAPASGLLYVGLTRTGAELVLCGDGVAVPALIKALHILARWQPRRVAFAQAGGRVAIFSGVWELAAHAEALARGWPAASGNIGAAAVSRRLTLPRS